MEPVTQGDDAVAADDDPCVAATHSAHAKFEEIDVLPGSMAQTRARLGAFERQCVPRIFGVRDMPTTNLYHMFTSANLDVGFAVSIHHPGSYVFAYDDVMHDSSRYRRAELASASATHEGVLPAVNFTKPRERFSRSMFLIISMETSSKAQGGGLGRRFLNICLAAMARNPHGMQTLVIDSCHWPMFRLTDRFFHMRYASDAPAYPTEPTEMFPDLHAPQTERAEYKRKYHTDISWSTPLEWFFWRAVAVGKQLGHTSGTESASPFALYGPVATRLVEFLARGAIATTPLPPPTDGHHMHVMHVGLFLAYNVRLRDAYFGLDPALVAWTESHCRLLGYSDVARDGAGGGGDDRGIVVLLVDVPPRLDATAANDTLVQFWLFHTLLVDYARTLYRPILYTSAAMAWFRHLLGEDVRNTTIWAVPDPAVARVSGATATFHVWIPVKKPLSINMRDDHLLPPSIRNAPEQPLIHHGLQYDDDDDGDDKNTRREQAVPSASMYTRACFSCMRPGASFHNGFIVHCDAACRDAYYHDA